MNLPAKALVSFVSIAALTVAVGCKKPGDAAKTDPAASASAAVSAAATAAAPTEVPADQFVSKLTPSTCKMLDACKNEKVKLVVTASAMLIAGFGSLDDKDAQAKISGIDKTMKAEKRTFPNNAECNTIGGIALGVMGFKADIAAKVGKTVSYDPKKAAACLTSIETPPEACKTETKVGPDPKMSEMDSISKELKPQLEGYAKACEEILQGMVDSGGACEQDYECKGKELKCKADKKTKAKTCQPKH